MDKLKEEMLKKLRDIKKVAQKDLKANNFENYEVKNVTHYNEKVELINKKNNKKEVFDLYVVTTENTKAKKGEDPIFEIEYLEDKKGKIFTIADLIREYEGFESIRDVIDNARENQEKDEEEQDKELRIDNLEELEAEEKEEKEEKEIDDESEGKKLNRKNDLTGTKPKYVIQTIDIDKAYIDNWTTVRRGFGIPAQAEQIAIAKPMQKDENILSSNMTMYMLDAKGNILEEVNGKTIKDYFKIDVETGKNPITDENAKLELDGYAERNEGQTMIRYRSTHDTDLYLSAEQKRVGDYAEIYAGRKTMNGNDSVEVQLETRNVGIQTSLEMQKVISGYKGIYNKENIDKEVDMHAEHGDNKEKIAIKNADGKINTVELCESPYIPGTDKTWEELSDETGEGVKKLQERFARELEKGKEPKDVLEEIEYDYEMIEPTRERK